MDPLLILNDKLHAAIINVLSLKIPLIEIDHAIPRSLLPSLGLAVLYLHVQLRVEGLHLVTQVVVGVLPRHVSGCLEEGLHVRL